MEEARRRYSIPLSRSILAALWCENYINKKEIPNHPYIKSLKKQPSTYRTAVFRLKQAGILIKEGDKLKLTEKGKEESLFAYIDAETAVYKTNFFQKWDGAWRILLFDIPENKRKYRDYLRKVLKRIGFKELQRSIWLYPYPVPSFLKEIVFHKDICAHSRLITTSKLEGDDDLRKIFNI